MLVWFRIVLDLSAAVPTFIEMELLGLEVLIIPNFMTKDCGYHNLALLATRLFFTTTLSSMFHPQCCRLTALFNLLCKSGINVILPMRCSPAPTDQLAPLKPSLFIETQAVSCAVSLRGQAPEEIWISVLQWDDSTGSYRLIGILQRTPRCKQWLY